MENNIRPEEKYNVWLPLLLSMVMVAGMGIGFKLSKDVSGPSISKVNNKHSEIRSSVDEVLNFIDAKYVDEVDQEEVIEEAIRTIVDELDPHSNFIPSRYLRDINDSMDGNFEGIGVEYLVYKDTIIVLEVTKGGPSDKVGLLAGDKIVSVDDSTIAGLSLKNNEIIDFLKGPKGSTVSVDVLRQNEALNFKIQRDRIELPSVDVAYMLNEEVAYIKINRFSSTTFREYMEAFEKMVKEDNAQHIVIDLRQNPGGLLKEATNILSQIFQEKGKLLVYTEGRTSKKLEYKTTGKNFFSVDKVAVLIDEGSASGSEILAGAIQDWDRGVLVGRRTFGKGLVQEQYPLKGGAALRLTVARYYIPSGRSIQKDYSDIDDYRNDYHERILSGELVERDSFKLIDTTVYYTDEKRKVFAKSGIMPDIFVPIDKYYLDADRFKINEQIPIYVYENLSKFPAQEFQDIESFMNAEIVSDAHFNEFWASIPDDLRTDKAVHKNEIKLLIKTRIAKHLFGDDGMYKVLNNDDLCIKEALAAFDNKNPLTLK